MSQRLSDSDNDFYKQQAIINSSTSAVTPTKSQIVHNRKKSLKSGAIQPQSRSKSPKPVSKEYTAETELDIPQTDDSALMNPLFNKPIPPPKS